MSKTSQSTQVYPRIVERAAATLPQTAQTPYFTVKGRVLITALVGEVTTVCQALPCSVQLIANPTVGADVNLCAVLDVNAKAVGTILNITGIFANAMVATTSGAVAPASRIGGTGILVAAGTIDFKATTSITGATKWTVHWIPLDAGSSLVVA